MTRFAAYVAEAFEAIWRNRTRSLLTMLGMIIGTSSIIAVLGLSRAASGGIAGTIASFGDQGLIVSVDNNQDDPNRAAIAFRARLTRLWFRGRIWNDHEALRPMAMGGDGWHAGRAVSRARGVR